VIDERGDRQFDLLVPPNESLARDSHPVLSPDDKWVVFASSRGRNLDETRLWIAPLQPSAEPRPLTDGVGIESHPLWANDGTIVFASTRDGGDFDLVSIRVVDGSAVGAPVALTSGPGHEVTPAVSRDGEVVYTVITPGEGGTVESHLEARAPDGTIRQLTSGPADTSPALSPDEKTILFARPVEHTAGLDADLWMLARGAAPETATQLIDLPLTDESGPVWSHDGRYVFATSVLRGSEGNVVFSSVIVIDMRAHKRTARVLLDRAGAIARLTPAITRTPLDAAALAADPEYLPELARIMAVELAKQREQNTKAP